jgi:hypothetical protein
VPAPVEALLRRVLGERDVDGILRVVLEVALGAVGSEDGTAYCWDAGSASLQPVAGRLVGGGVAAAAAERRGTVVEGDEVGVVLMRSGELIGALRVGGTGGQVALIEELAAVAAGAVVWFEAVRLDGALLAARTAEHEVNNRLVATAAYAQMLVRDPTFPPHLLERAESIAKGAKEAAVIVRKLRELADLQETRWGPDPELTTIDLDRSARVEREAD